MSLQCMSSQVKTVDLVFLQIKIKTQHVHTFLKDNTRLMTTCNSGLHRVHVCTHVQTFNSFHRLETIKAIVSVTKGSRLKKAVKL